MAKKPTPPKPTGPRKITGTASSRKVENKTLKPGSMATQSKIVVVKPKKKVLKRPTGQLSKSNSALAKFIASTKSNNLSLAQSRVAAGKFEDIAKATPGFNRKMGYLDRSGAALGKAVKQTQKMTKQKKR